MPFFSQLAYWNHKQPSDNLWHPLPGASWEGSKQLERYVPNWFLRIDIEAMAVDVAPFVCGAGALAHLRQLPRLGWTVPASVFSNQRTLDAMFRTGYIGVLGVGALMLAGVDYRYAVPRWAHDREKRRNEDEVRKLIMPGEFLGIGLYAARIFRRGGISKLGPWRVVPLEIIFGIALSDLAHREYCKAHGL